jgi:predicted membrane protein
MHSKALAVWVIGASITVGVGYCIGIRRSDTIQIRFCPLLYYNHQIQKRIVVIHISFDHVDKS